MDCRGNLSRRKGSAGGKEAQLFRRPSSKVKRGIYHLSFDLSSLTEIDLSLLSFAQYTISILFLSFQTSTSTPPPRPQLRLLGRPRNLLRMWPTAAPPPPRRRPRRRRTTVAGRDRGQRGATRARTRASTPSRSTVRRCTDTR